MANDILSVKLHELDEKVSRIYSRILMLESADHASIRREKASLMRECEENELSIRERMQCSESKVVGEFSEAYAELEEVLNDLKDRLGAVLNKTRFFEAASPEDTGICAETSPADMSQPVPSAECGKSSEKNSFPTLTSLVQANFTEMNSDDLVELAERKILLAEYSLDFAMLASDHALLFSLDALDAQMTSEEV